MIAATDYMRRYADQIRAFVPQRYVVLGTDGYGRSDTREQLRRHFEVDRQCVAVAALKALADEGALKPDMSAKPSQSTVSIPRSLTRCASDARPAAGTTPGANGWPGSGPTVTSEGQVGGWACPGWRAVVDGGARPVHDKAVAKLLSKSWAMLQMAHRRLAVGHDRTDMAAPRLHHAMRPEVERRINRIDPDIKQYQAATPTATVVLIP